MSASISAYGGQNTRLQMTSVIYVSPLIDPPAPEHDGLAPLREQFEIPEAWRNSLQQDAMGADLIDETKDALTDHIHHAFRATGEILGTDVIAIIPDGAFLWASVQELKVYDLASVIRKAFPERAQLQTEGGISIIKSVDLTQTRLRRIPRAALRRLLIRHAQQGEVDVDISADLAVASPNNLSYWHAISFAQMAAPFHTGFYGEPDLLRVYGGLSTGQRELAKKGGVQLPYQNLNADQRAALDRMMNAPSAGLSTLGAAPDIRFSSYGSFLARENIQLTVPPKLPPQTPITVRLGAISTVFGISSQNPQNGVYEIDPSSLASARVNHRGVLSALDRFISRDDSILQLIADFGKDGRFARASSPAPAPKATAKWMTMEELPTGFREEFNRIYKALLDQKTKGGG